MRCINNVGLEEYFVKGETYQANDVLQDDDSMISVKDEHGQYRQCFRDRFEFVSKVDSTDAIDEDIMRQLKTLRGLPPMKSVVMHPEDAAKLSAEQKAAVAMSGMTLHISKLAEPGNIIVMR